MACKFLIREGTPPHGGGGGGCGCGGRCSGGGGGCGCGGGCSGGGGCGCGGRCSGGGGGKCGCEEHGVPTASVVIINGNSVLGQRLPQAQYSGMPYAQQQGEKMPVVFFQDTARGETVFMPERIADPRNAGSLLIFPENWGRKNNVQQDEEFVEFQ